MSGRFLSRQRASPRHGAWRGKQENSCLRLTPPRAGSRRLAARVVVCVVETVVGAARMAWNALVSWSGSCRSCCSCHSRPATLPSSGKREAQRSCPLTVRYPILLEESGATVATVVARCRRRRLRDRLGCFLVLSLSGSCRCGWKARARRTTARAGQHVTTWSSCQMTRRPHHVDTPPCVSVSRWTPDKRRHEHME